MLRYASIGFVMITATIFGIVSAHPLCRDSTNPISSALSRCTSYNGLPNCCPSGDSFVQRVQSEAVATGTASTQCVEMLQTISCATCDSWSIHLYGVEDGSSPNRNTPRLCQPLCRDLFQACGYATLSRISDWSSIPFTDSADSFCAAHSATEYCYNGSPYTISAPESFENLASSGQVCLEKMLDDPFEETLRWANIVDYNHIDPNVMLLGRQTGQIHAFRAQANGQLIDQGMFLDLSSVVFALGERGLIGIALHKNYAQNGRMFVTVSCRFGVPPYGDHCERDGGTIIMEYSVPMRTISSIISGGSRPVFQKVILSVPKPYGNHNGGQLLFSPAPQENNLFIFLGDGGGQGDPEGFSQNMNVLHGKVLRIDVDNANPYGIPADNPFANMTNGIRREIFAYGLRNPWRNSIDFHRPSRIFTGDVGENLYEEIDVIIPGGNYGWSVREGFNDYKGANSPDFIAPIIEYSHEYLGRGGPGSVTGGYVYRGTDDSCLYGHYVYADLYNQLFVATPPPRRSIRDRWQSSQASWLCSRDSPLACDATLEQLYTFGEWRGDEAQLVFTTARGVYRIVSPDKCGLQSCPAPARVDNRNAPLNYANDEIDSEESIPVWGTPTKNGATRTTTSSWFGMITFSSMLCFIVSLW